MTRARTKAACHESVVKEHYSDPFAGLSAEYLADIKRRAEAEWATLDGRTAAQKTRDEWMAKPSEERARLLAEFDA